VLEHAIIDRDSLMRQRIDAGYLGGEGRIGQVSERQPLALHQHADDFWLGGEVQQRRFCWIRRRLRLGDLQSLDRLIHAVVFLAQVQKGLPRELGWPGLTVLPSVDRGKRDTKALRQGDLSQSQLRPQILDPFRVVVCQSVRHARHLFPCGSKRKHKAYYSV